MDSGPRDRGLPTRSDARRVATSPTINKIVWEHSPTRMKWRDRTRLNRGVASPINCPHVSSMSSTRGAPHGRPRGAAWSRGHLPRCRAPCALTSRFCASLKHKYDGQTKFIKPNSQRQDRIIKYWVSIGSIHREQG